VGVPLKENNKDTGRGGGGRGWEEEKKEERVSGAKKSRMNGEGKGGG
jgi:hypothetical protein